jgi:hypothetical protein
MMYLEFTVSQTMEHWLACHQNAFEVFGSVPKKIMVDNLKSAVLKRIIGQAPLFNPKYLDFANQFDWKCGSAPVACQVDALFRFISSAPPGRTFRTRKLKALMNNVLTALTNYGCQHYFPVWEEAAF